MSVIKTAKGTYKIRGNWSAEELKKLYASFVRKYGARQADGHWAASLSFDRWLIERGKVYFRY
jgi:hypothetical protein